MPIPLIEELTAGPIPAGSNLLVEFDVASQWYNASVTIAAGWLRTGESLVYNVSTQPPDKIRAQLNRLGVDALQLEADSRLEIWDLYTATLGQKSNEKCGADSLKVADLSIAVAKQTKEATYGSECLRIQDNGSVMVRFNDEKWWVEFLLTRYLPRSFLRKSTLIYGLMHGFHGDWAYKALESAVDGIVDFKLDETGGATKDLIRLRSMRNVDFDRRWHQLKVKENFEVILEKQEAQRP